VRIEVAEDDNAIFGPVRNASYLFLFPKGIANRGTEELLLGFSDVFPGLGVNMKAQVLLYKALSQMVLSVGDILWCSCAVLGQRGEILQNFHNIAENKALLEDLSGDQFDGWSS